MNEKVKIKHWVIVVLTLVFTWFFGDWRTAHAATGSITNTSACYNIYDADARTMCLARAHREPSQCYSIQRANLRSQCLAEVRK